MDAGEVHVGDAGGEGGAGGEDVFGAGGRDPEVVRVLAGDGIEADGRDRVAGEGPRLAAVATPGAGVDDLGTGVLEPGRQAVAPHPRVLDHVVVDGDDLDVVREHCVSSSS